MHFLPDVFIPCDTCKGARYNRETLEIRFKNKNIADVLDMTVDEGCDFFENIQSIKSKLITLKHVGLGYMKIGQQATTLSGGEAQRIKLAKELSKRPTGRTLYILDEPTTGLHSHDIKKLLEILQAFANTGNTVVVIEHNLDVIKTADHIIDMGPEGGINGGKIIAEGTPEKVSTIKESYTGKFIKEIISNGSMKKLPKNQICDINESWLVFYNHYQKPSICPWELLYYYFLDFTFSVTALFLIDIFLVGSLDTCMF